MGGGYGCFNVPLSLVRLASFAIFRAEPSEFGKTSQEKINKHVTVNSSCMQIQLVRYQ